MNKTTRSLTDEEFVEVVTAVRDGIGKHRGNPRVALALQVEATALIRIGDVVRLRLADFIRTGNGWHISITEQKTNKRRNFEVPEVLVNALQEFALSNDIGRNDRLFDITAHGLSKYLKEVCQELTESTGRDYSEISSHSFRKYGSTRLYNASGYNIELVSRALQHSSSTITKRYIGVDTETVNTALAGNICMI